MKQEAILHDLLYINEHLSCKKYLSEANVGFTYVEPSESVVIEREYVSRNYLFLFVKGKATISCNEFNNRVFEANQMVMIPRSSRLRWEANRDTGILILGFEIPENPCDKLLLQSYYTQPQNFEYDFQPIPLRYPVTAFAELLIFLLKNKMNCSHLHILKQQELFLLLRGFYTKEELAILFHPMIAKDLDFKDFILQNYKNVNNINELIELSSLGKSSFFTKFKEVFGITAKQWMLKQTTLKVQYELSKPDASIKEVMATCGFDSPAMFNQFCRQHFDETPGQLIKKYQSIIQ
ncbi:helix-turn-helix domain-containing protein [Bacteroides fragilis]|nr:AraC family transcriptional regulator [Bacteroides fragilis]